MKNFRQSKTARQVQTLKDLLEACPEDRFHFMTPFGYVDLNAQDAERLRQGAAMRRHIPAKADGKYQFRQKNCCSRSWCPRERLRMVNGTRSPLIRSRNWKNRSRCGRCTCDRQPFPHRRARVGGLCGFPDAAERVPAKHQKTGRCADVRGCCGRAANAEEETPAGGSPAESRATSGEAGQSRGVVRTPRRSHLPAVRAVWGFRTGVVARAKIAPMGS